MIDDEYGLTGAIPWVYTCGDYWHIEWWTTEEKARARCPEGYECKEYWRYKK